MFYVVHEWTVSLRKLRKQNWTNNTDNPLFQLSSKIVAPQNAQLGSNPVSYTWKTIGIVFTEKHFALTLRLPTGWKNAIGPDFAEAMAK